MQHDCGCPRGGEIVDYCIGLCSCGECPTPRPDWSDGEPLRQATAPAEGASVSSPFPRTPHPSPEKGNP